MLLMTSVARPCAAAGERAAEGPAAGGRGGGHPGKHRGGQGALRGRALRGWSHGVRGG